MDEIAKNMIPNTNSAGRNPKERGGNFLLSPATA
jgi:hypothetical protein